MALNENLIIYIQRASHFHNDFRRLIVQPNEEADSGSGLTKIPLLNIGAFIYHRMLSWSL